MPWQYHGYHSDTQSHGLIIHQKKSVIIPKQTIISSSSSSSNMNLSLIDQNKARIKDCSNDILSCKGETIRKFVELTVNLVARFLQ